MTANPLRGPNPPELGGPRFLDLSGQTVGGTGGVRGGEGRAGIAAPLTECDRA